MTWQCGGARRTSWHRIFRTALRSLKRDTTHKNHAGTKRYAGCSTRTRLCADHRHLQPHAQYLPESALGLAERAPPDSWALRQHGCTIRPSQVLCQALPQTGQSSSSTAPPPALGVALPASEACGQQWRGDGLARGGTIAGHPAQLTRERCPTAAAHQRHHRRHQHARLLFSTARPRPAQHARRGGPLKSSFYSQHTQLRGASPHCAHPCPAAETLAGRPRPARSPVFTKDIPRGCLRRLSRPSGGRYAHLLEDGDGL